MNAFNQLIIIITSQEPAPARLLAHMTAVITQRHESLWPKNVVLFYNYNVDPCTPPTVLAHSHVK
jgi:hypothetical protein